MPQEASTSRSTALPRPRDPIATAALERSARMLDALGQAVIATDLTGSVTYWNAQAEALYGWTAAEAVGRSVTELTVAEVGQPSAAEIMESLRGGVPWTGAFPVRRKDGSTFVALVTDTALHDEQDRIEGVIGLSVNLGEALRPYLVHASEAAVVTGPDAVVRYASPAVGPVFGWDDEALVGCPLEDLVHPDDVGALREQVATVAAADEPVVAELRVRRSDGTHVWVEGRWTSMLADPGIRGLVAVLRDVDERHAALDRMTELALKDPLTGLPNRSVLVEVVEHAAARRDPHGAVLFVDLDGFKEVNDRLGHAAGDLLLRTVAERLRRAVRPEDTCGRWAGDEFLVVTDTVSSRQEAEALCARVRHALEQPVRLERTLVQPRASVGAALLDAGVSAEQVLRRADRAMYREKRLRRRTAQVAGPA